MHYNTSLNEISYYKSYSYSVYIIGVILLVKIV